jgi:hypothetical protein
VRKGINEEFKEVEAKLWGGDNDDWEKEEKIVKGRVWMEWN